MTIENLIESEIDAVKDYLYMHAENPLETASDDLKAKLKNLPTYDIQTILEYAEKETSPCYMVPSNTPYSIWLNIPEIEVSTDLIEPTEIDDVTIDGELAYIYIGYGIIFEYDEHKLNEAIKELK